MPAEFHDVRIPLAYSYGTRGGPGFRTRIFERDSGFNHRIDRWDYIRSKFTATYSVRSLNDISRLLEFYLCRNGPVYGFRFKDYEDFTTAENGVDPPTAFDQELRPVGSSGLFYQLEKVYTDDEGHEFTRPITKPRGGTVKIAVGGVIQTTGWSVDTNQGLVQFDNVPEGVVTGGCEFDIPVRFSEDQAFTPGIDAYEIGSITVELVELIAEDLNANYVLP